MELVNIIKRDGRVVDFDANKITEAIRKAYVSTNTDQVVGGKDEPAVLCEQVLSIASEKDWGEKGPTVEGIQDIVEQVLIANNYANVAKEYIVYRKHRSDVREMKDVLMQTFKEITFTDALDSDIKRENANINTSAPMGAMLKFGSESSKRFYELFIMKPEHRKAYDEGWIHCHDLDFASTGTLTCCQISLCDLFSRTFHTGHGSIRPPKSITSYGALAAIVLQSDQNDQHDCCIIKYNDI